MKYNKIIPYKLKRALSMATIIGATMLTPGCDDEIEPQHDIEIEFDDGDIKESMTMEHLQKCANDKSIRYIYMVPVKHWNSAMAGNITFMRNKSLQPRLDISPKIRGRGDFDFCPGEASKVPDDSLWYVRNGWTINQQYQNQK